MRETTWENATVEHDTLYINPNRSFEKLLLDFSYLFNESPKLLFIRFCDHKIFSLFGFALVVVWAYSHTHLQKDVIEWQSKEMLLQGIRQSKSPFSSLVLLVNKHDVSKRFYIDYQELNIKTIKDKFSIPIVEALIDELHSVYQIGSQIRLPSN